MINRTQPNSRGSQTPTMAPSTPQIPSRSHSRSSMHVKRVTLTSKKNWWMVELDEEEEETKEKPPSQAFADEDVHHDTAYPSYNDYTSVPPTPHAGFQTHVHVHPHAHAVAHPHALSHPPTRPASPPASPPFYNPPRHPSAIFSFPTPTSYAAPPNPTSFLAPFSVGSTSELFKCIVKKPDVVTLEINGEVQSNAADVATQFLAELRVYTSVARHRNLTTFLGCLEGVGLVLEYVDGGTLWDVLAAGALPPAMQREFHNQLLDGLTHLHAAGLSHGDLSLLNVRVNGAGALKLLDFGRSVHADSLLVVPAEDEPPPAAYIDGRRVEQIHPGTRPFCAPEILRGECADARLADAYSFGMLLVCLARGTCVDVPPALQRADKLPDGFLDGCEVFGPQVAEYLARWDVRRRLVREDMLEV